MGTIPFVAEKKEHMHPMILNKRANCAYMPDSARCVPWCMPCVRATRRTPCYVCVRACVCGNVYGGDLKQAVPFQVQHTLVPREAG